MRRGANAVKEQRLQDENEGLLTGRRRHHRSRGGRGHGRLQCGPSEATAYSANTEVMHHSISRRDGGDAAMAVKG